MKELRNGGYFKLVLPPGPHAIRTFKRGFQDWGGTTRASTFDTSKGQIHFIKYNVSGNAVVGLVSPLLMALTSDLELHLVPPELAEKEIGELRESD